MNVTENEKITILNIARNLMNSANGGVPKSTDETWCYADQIISDGKIDFNPRSLPGVMSSLNKKGLVASGGNNVQLTDAGFKVYVEVVEPWYQARLADARAKIDAGRQLEVPQDMCNLVRNADANAVEAAKVVTVGSAFDYEGRFETTPVRQEPRKRSEKFWLVVDVVDYFNRAHANGLQIRIDEYVKELNQSRFASEILHNIEWHMEPLIAATIKLQLVEEMLRHANHYLEQEATGKIEDVKVDLYISLNKLRDEWVERLYQNARSGNSTSQVANLITRLRTSVLAEEQDGWNDMIKSFLQMINE